MQKCIQFYCIFMVDIIIHAATISTVHKVFGKVGRPLHDQPCVLSGTSRQVTLFDIQCKQMAEYIDILVPFFLFLLGCFLCVEKSKCTWDQISILVKKLLFCATG